MDEVNALRGRNEPALAEQALEREGQLVGNVMKIRLYPFVPATSEGTRIGDVDGKDYLTP